MRRLIFLDFDGVLHAYGEPLLSRLPRLEHYLSKMPQAEVVISSSWRETRSFERLRDCFSASLRARIIGVTPMLDRGYEEGCRQREIEAFLEANGLSRANASWIALDDIRFFFQAGCPYLVLVAADRGFGDDEGRALLEWYASA